MKPWLSVCNKSPISTSEIQYKVNTLINGFVVELNGETQKEIPLDLIKLIHAFFYHEPVESLQDKLISIRSLRQYDKMLDIQLMIVWDICNSSWILFNDQDPRIYRKILFDQKVLKNILNDWKINNKLEKCRNLIRGSIEICIKRNNVKILRVITNMFTHSVNIYTFDDIMEFINIGAKCASMDCLKVLFQCIKDNPASSWDRYKQEPKCLLNAITDNPTNLELIHYIIDKMEETNIQFVCSDIWKELMLHNHLKPVRSRIVNNQWIQN